MAYQAAYQADTRAQIPGSRLHAESQTRTLHADRGRGGGPSDGGSGSGPRDSGPRDSGPCDSGPCDSGPCDSAPMRLRSMQQAMRTHNPCPAPPADARARECAPAQPRLSAASLTTGAGERRAKTKVRTTARQTRGTRTGPQGRWTRWRWTRRRRPRRTRRRWARAGGLGGGGRDDEAAELATANSTCGARHRHAN